MHPKSTSTAKQTQKLLIRPTDMQPLPPSAAPAPAPAPPSPRSSPSSSCGFKSLGASPQAVQAHDELLRRRICSSSKTCVLLHLSTTSPISLASRYVHPQHIHLPIFPPFHFRRRFSRVATFATSNRLTLDIDATKP